jgi:hypothetical protein
LSLPQLALLLQKGGDLGVGAGQLDHARHLDDRPDVRLFDRALHDMGLAVRQRRRLHAVRRGEGRGAVLAQLLRIVERHQAELAAGGIRIETLALANLDRAVVGDGDVAVGGLKDDRPVVAEDLVAGQGHELADVVELQRAVAGVALAARGLHHQHAFAVDGEVQRAAGLLDRALAHVVPAHPILHQADASVRPRKRLGIAAALQKFGEHRAVRLKSGGVDVGDVVGDHVELALQRGLPRQANEKRILHRLTPP